MRVQGFENIISGYGEFAYYGGVRCKSLAEYIECKDGAILSVQASSVHHCTPESESGPYSHVQVSYMTKAPPGFWYDYIDGDFPFKVRDRVYGYIPVEVVAEYIESHGGEA